MTDAQLEKLEHYEKSGVFSELEMAVLRFADQWTRQGEVAPDVVKQLSRNLSPTQLIVLAATVGLANWTNRFNESFAVELP